MRIQTHLLALLVLGASASVASAQNKYDVFVGQYMAASLLASECQGIGVLAPEAAGTIAKSDDQLRKQKVLRILYYGKTVQLQQAGRQSLSERQVDPDNKVQLCRFGGSVLGTKDAIGRFLRAN